MKHLGDFDASAVIYGKFTSYQPSTGAPFALAGTPALSVYKDNSTTESTTGVTLTVSFDSRTGLNHYAIDTSADGTFYSAGSFFDIVITTGTVDGVSVVGAVIGSFTLRKTSALKPATAGRTLVVDASGLADANAVKVGPTGAGTAQTARDIGASVLLSSGTGAGQVSLSSGKVSLVAADIATIEGGTWDVVLSGHLTSGSTGAALNAAGSAGDPWETALPGAYGAGTAGKIVGDNVNATISSRLASGSYTAPDNTTITAINAKTTNLPASPAAVSDIPTANANADALLDRAAGVETSRTLRQSMRLMLAALTGKLSGAATTTVVIRDTNDTKDRLTATVDANGNRTAVTYDAS